MKPIQVSVSFPGSVQFCECRRFLAVTTQLYQHSFTLRIMHVEGNLQTLLKTMKPVLNTGSYVFCTVNETDKIELHKIISLFKEEEGYTVILTKDEADRLQLPYNYVAAWITLTVHSSLDAVGLTAAFSNALAAENISCNIVAGFYHDHIFVALADAPKAISILQALSEQ